MVSEPIIMEGMAVCPHCGQIVQVEPKAGETPTEAAERVCRCAGAMAARSRAEQIDKAREMIDALFGDDCYEKYGVARVGDKTLAVLSLLCVDVIDGEISGAKIQINGLCRADVSIGAKGELKLKRTEGRSFAEEG